MAQTEDDNGIKKYWVNVDGTWHELEGVVNPETGQTHITIFDGEHDGGHRKITLIGPAMNDDVRP